jgi:hypothetical protein
VFDMMEEVGKRQQQRYVTFPVTVASSSREVDPDTKNIQKPHSMKMLTLTPMMSRTRITPACRGEHRTDEGVPSDLHGIAASRIIAR